MGMGERERERLLKWGLCDGKGRSCEFLDTCLSSFPKLQVLYLELEVLLTKGICFRILSMTGWVNCIEYQNWDQDQRCLDFLFHHQTTQIGFPVFKRLLARSPHPQIRPVTKQGFFTMIVHSLTPLNLTLLHRFATAPADGKYNLRRCRLRIYLHKDLIPVMNKLTYVSSIHRCSI